MTPRRFVVLCVRRTGSNFLCGMLNAHPQILCHHELFNHSAIYFAYNHRDGQMGVLDDKARRDAAPKAYLHDIWRAHFNHSAIGFKLLDIQNRRILKMVLRDRGVHKIVLHRRNRLRTFVSLRRAVALGQCAHRDYGTLRIHVKMHELERFIDFYDQYYVEIRNALNHTEQRWSELVYEDLLTSSESLRPVLSRLGVSPVVAALQPENRRQGSGALRNAILNYEEMAAALQGTPLEADLDLPTSLAM